MCAVDFLFFLEIKSSFVSPSHPPAVTALTPSSLICLSYSASFRQRHHQSPLVSLCHRCHAATEWYKSRLVKSSTLNLNLSGLLMNRPTLRYHLHDQVSLINSSIDFAPESWGVFLAETQVLLQFQPAVAAGCWYFRSDGANLPEWNKSSIHRLKCVFILRCQNGVLSAKWTLCSLTHYLFASKWSSWWKLWISKVTK